MGLASISGMVSGLDTASIISQLMQVEAIPQSLLKNRIASEKSAVTSLQSINSKLAALVTKAQDMAKPGGWNPIKAVSSSDQATAKASSSAVPGELRFTVQQTAERHQLTFSTAARGADVVTRDGSTEVRLDLLDGTDPLRLDTGDGTLTGLVKAVNEADAGVRAYLVNSGDGTSRLRVESVGTGKASDFTLTDDLGNDLLGGATVVAGRDAEISLGGSTFTSSTNTYANLLDGLDVTLTSKAVAGSDITVTVSRDASAVKSSAKSFVDAVNAVLTEIDVVSGFNSTTKKASSLNGNPTLRAIRNELLSAVTNVGDGESLATVGIQLDRAGRLTLDEAKFSEAFTADPDAVSRRMLGHTVGGGSPVLGFLGRIEGVAQSASAGETGTLTLALKSRNTAIDDLQKSVEAWDTRLDLRRKALTRQFTALETSLGQLQSQSSWLAGQINSLPKMSSSS